MKNLKAVLLGEDNQLLPQFFHVITVSITKAPYLPFISYILATWRGQFISKYYELIKRRNNGLRLFMPF